MELERLPAVRSPRLELVIEAPPCPGNDRILAVGAEACAVLSEAGIPFMVGGCVALWAYGRLRCTKDIDLMLPANMPIKAMDLLASRGFHTRDMDASWLYKAIKDDILIDLIVWTSGNVRLDAETFQRVRPIRVNGHRFDAMGPEDLLLRSLLSFREDCPKGWFDALSMVERPIPGFDWSYFLRRLGAKYARRGLGFLIHAQGEFGASVVPKEIIHQLLERAEVAPDPDRPGLVTFLEVETPCDE